MKFCSRTLASILMAASLVGSAALAQDAFDPAMPKATPGDQLSFFNLNEAIQMADAYGSLTTGAHGTFGKFPANFDAGAHTHTGAYHGIVIKGVMTNPFKDETNPPQMGPGSYWYVPAGMAHSTACISDEPCEFFFFANSGFDFEPVQ